MSRTVTEINAVRSTLVAAALGHTFDPLPLVEGEDLAVTYSLASDQATMTIAATVRVVEAFDPATGTLSISPYQISG